MAAGLGRVGDSGGVDLGRPGSAAEAAHQHHYCVAKSPGPFASILFPILNSGLEHKEKKPTALFDNSVKPFYPQPRASRLSHPGGELQNIGLAWSKGKDKIKPLSR